MSSKQEYTVGYIMSLLKHCSQDAYINIMLNEDGIERSIAITSIYIHENEDKKELVSFLHEKDENNDL